LLNLLRFSEGDSLQHQSAHSTAALSRLIGLLLGGGYGSGGSAESESQHNDA